MMRHVFVVVQEDWEPLLRETGFKLQSIQSTRGIFRILLADPV
jgi:hypothetical protein